jgi:acyl-CoA thioester hydrolase
VVTRVEKVSAAKIEHSYRMFRGDTLIASATSILACVDREGRVQRIPESLGDRTP